jgi:hypothetical protein
MKKMLLTLLSMTMLSMANGQEVKPPKEKMKIVYAETMTSNKTSMILLGAHVTVENKLDIEADRILVDRDRTMITAYRAKNFTFSGKVIFGKQNKRGLQIPFGGGYVGD